MPDNQEEQQSPGLRAQVKQQTIGYIASALGLVAALAWNDAIKALIQKIFPSNGSTVIAQFVYAIIVTLFVVVVTVYLYKIFKVNKK